MVQGSERSIRRVRRVADQVELGMIADAKTANGAEALAERANHKVHLILDTVLLDEPATTLAKHAQRMRLIHHERGAIFSLDLHDLRQRRLIAEHAVDAFHHDQGAGRGLGFESVE